MNAKLTIKEMTARYNVAAAELDLPIVKKLKPTKEFKTVADRYNAMVKLLDETIDTVIARNEKAIKKAAEKPRRPPIMTAAERKQVVKEAKADVSKAKQAERAQTSIKHTRPGTSIYVVIEALLEGGTVHELSTYLKNHGVSWTENALRAALSWDVPKKGYTITKTDTDKGTQYQIGNSQYVL